MRFAADPSANGGSVGRILSRGSTRRTPPGGTEVAATGRTIRRARALHRKAGVRISAAPSSSSLALAPSSGRQTRRTATTTLRLKQPRAAATLRYCNRRQGAVSRVRSWPRAEGLGKPLQSCFVVATSTLLAPNSDPQRAETEHPSAEVLARKLQTLPAEESPLARKAGSTPGTAG